MAVQALDKIEKELMGAVGMKTLSSDDPDYRPIYDNGMDGEDFATAHGLNYHQGPEWLWPVGYLLKAKMIFSSLAAEEGMSGNSPVAVGGGGGGSSKCGGGGGGLDEYERMRRRCLSLLFRHKKYIEKDAWGSLPELTNRDGGYCKDSCGAQAWSIGTLLDAIHTCLLSSSLPHSFDNDFFNVGLSSTTATTATPSKAEGHSHRHTVGGGNTVGAEGSSSSSSSGKGAVAGGSNRAVAASIGH
eukprot:Filipodium_phascolosomae@DN5739_c0_g1_i1.p1